MIADTLRRIILSSGNLYSFGNNYYGQLGQGTSDYNSHPVPVKVGTDTWTVIAGGGYFSLAINSDGYLYSFGINTSGQLGLGDTSQRNSPVKVGTDTWTVIATGQYHSLAINSDGYLYSFGRNNYGQLGLGDTSQRNSPVKVGTDTWIAVAGGESYSLARRG